MCFHCLDNPRFAAHARHFINANYKHSPKHFICSDFFVALPIGVRFGKGGNFEKDKIRTRGNEKRRKKMEQNRNVSSFSPVRTYTVFFFAISGRVSRSHFCVCFCLSICVYVLSTPLHCTRPGAGAGRAFVGETDGAGAPHSLRTENPLPPLGTRAAQSRPASPNLRTRHSSVPAIR